MCFSAEGSFALAGVLAATGVASVALPSAPERKMFAAVPLLFAAQQAAEGTVWLTITDPAHYALNRLATNMFLGLALVVWPTWLPVSLERIERDPVRRRMLSWLTWCGLAVSVGAAVMMARWQPVPTIAGHSITYTYALSDDARRSAVFLAAYIIPTMAPFLVSTSSMSRVIGTTMLLSLAAAVIVQRAALTSVWCFFAAMVSGLIVFATDRERRFATSQQRVRPDFNLETKSDS